MKVQFVCLHKIILPVLKLTSVHVSREIISIWVGYEVLRSGFLSSVTELAHAEGDHPIETLASVIPTTNKYAFVSEVCHQRLVNVSR